MNIKFFRTIMASMLMLSMLACTDNGEVNSLKGLDDFNISDNELDRLVELSGLHKSSENRISRKKQQYKERNDLAKAIMEEGSLDHEFLVLQIKQSRNELIIKHHLDSFIENSIDDASVAEYYEKNIDEYSIKRIHAAQIVLTVPHDADKNTQAEINKRAKLIASELRRGKSVKDVIADADARILNSTISGDLGWVKYEKLPEYLKNVVDVLKEGDVAEPILTQYGYHVVTLLEPIEKNAIDFDMVKSKIKYKLEYESKVNELNRLKAKAGVH